MQYNSRRVAGFLSEASSKGLLGSRIQTANCQSSLRDRTSTIPNRCFVPNCKTGYPSNKPASTLSLFAPPKDKALFKQWEQYIPRKDTKLKPSSRVCSRHFEEDDVIKGRMIKGKDGKEIFHAWKNWTLKRIKNFSSFFYQCNIDCPSHLTKPKPAAKRKLPKDRETADVRKHENAKHLGEPQEDIDDVFQNCEGMPWLSFNPKDCPLPPAWFWTNSKDESAVPLCVQFELIPGETTESKSVHLKDGQNFDEAHKCHGIREGRFANIKFCTGAVLQDDTWRSTNCKTFFDVKNKNFYDPSSHSLPEDVLKWVQKTIEIGTPVCSECCTIRRALVKKVTQPNPISEKEKLTKLRADYRLAQQKLVRNKETVT
ncbi:hypothetical protein GHT06_015194 [Daphnia sinensis]|uniref:THAP-type domain-containing protein n=1 Tax=Daphnia sinensis TaxID=1820382 RepID=A0AAD5KSY3_9CRUS|nr:hypothetical protein GHT06_015194 [Daphnia sinensis]